MSNIYSDSYWKKLERQADRELNKLYKDYNSGPSTADKFKGIPFVEWGAAAGQVVDEIFSAAGGGFNYLDQQTSENIGMSKWAQIGNAIMKAFPGNNLWSPFFRKQDNFNISDATLKLGGSYAGAMNKMMNAEKVAGTRLPFGGKAASSTIKEATKLNNILSDMSLENDKYLSNYAPQIMATNYAMNHQGYTPGNSFVLGNKHGGTIPELDEVRSIMQSLQSKKQEIQEPQKFQLGGKMNMIVTGALHARKHNLEELNPNLEGEITKKGIPVVVMNEGGEVQSQQAEVETGEIIMQIDATKTIEDYYDEYNSTDSKTEKNKIAFECGKYLVDELLKNTDDPDKLIKKTE